MPADTSPTNSLAPVEVTKPRTLQEAKTRGAGVPMTQHGGSFLPAFTDVGQVMEFAALMSGAGPMVGKVCRGNPGACAAVIMMAGRFGLDPFLLSHKAYQTKDDAPMAWEAQAINAMIMGAGVLEEPLDYVFDGEGLERRVTVIGRLKGASRDRTITTNKLENIKPQNSPNWKNEPDQQLAYYGSRLWIRRHAPHVLMGVYDREEVEIIPGSFVTVTPETADPAERLIKNLAAGRKAPQSETPSLDPAAPSSATIEPETDEHKAPDSSSEEDGAAPLAAAPTAAKASEQPDAEGEPTVPPRPPHPGELIRTRKGALEYAARWAAYYCALPRDEEDAFIDETAEV